MIEVLALISARGPKPFTGGIVLIDDVVTETAPILGFMKKNKFTRDQVREYCRVKGWKIDVVYEEHRPDP
jgi:hypothetical protein